MRFQWRISLFFAHTRNSSNSGLNICYFVAFLLIATNNFLTLTMDALNNVSGRHSPSGWIMVFHAGGAEFDIVQRVSGSVLGSDGRCDLQGRVI